MSKIDISWENLTKEVEIDIDGAKGMPLPEEIDKEYEEMTKTMRITDFGGYDITEKKLDNGWYELSTTAFSMGEEYRERRRFDHKPYIEDYVSFVQEVNRNK